ncbi:hypothetical protein TNCV_1339011 [Trichonephila clavipes]|nr:hypothetical protein TNCV_1339011 [Trichonephila clavipes]
MQVNQKGNTHLTARYITHFSSPVTIRVKNVSFLYWKRNSAFQSSRSLAVRLYGTPTIQLPRQMLTSRLSIVVWSSLKVSTNSCSVGFWSPLMIRPTSSSPTCEGRPLLA